ncbi:acyltransferase [Mycetocola sp. 2940]|uniref:acyltransferase family protein n=1 Tax=Mycetocola sp. 2940 TaxID=3156452 RepID=UPI00339AFBC1
MTLDETFNPQRNSLNAFRLLLASLVVVSHSWLLSGTGLQPRLGGIDLGTWAVLGFFGISGFLITRSRLSARSAGTYYRNRALRILPAFLVCILVVAFVFAPLSVLLRPGASYSIPSAVTYVLTNLPLSAQFLSQKGIESTLLGVPITGYWNGPLWTLFWEACCYLLVGVLVSVLPKRWVRVFVVAMFGAATVLVVLTTAGVLTVGPSAGAVFPLFVAFFAGSLAFLFRRAIDVSWPVLVACILVIVASVLVGFAAAFAALPFVLLLLRLSAVLPLHRVGARYDMSYGIYIYGWPVQQLLALVTLGTGMPVAGFIALSLVLTAPLAFLSCLVVERPALARKHGRTGMPKPAAPALQS